MVHDTPLLVRLMMLIDDLPLPPPGPGGRGRPVVYGDRLFLKALVLMVVRRLPTAHGLLAVLAEPEMASVRARLTLADGRYPSRRTWERRLGRLPDTLPALIALLGALLDPWAAGGRAVAIDSTALRAKGGVWHKTHREAGVVPHTSIDTQAHWTTSDWHGWVYGWKLHLLVTVADVWIPLAADLTPANVADNEHAPVLLEATLLEDLFVLGDTTYNKPDGARPLRRPQPHARGERAGPLPPHRRRGGGAPPLPRAALARHRERQRPVQGHLRCRGRGAHARRARHPALRPGRGPGLPTRAPPLPCRRARPSRRPQTPAQGDLMIYDQASPS